MRIGNRLTVAFGDPFDLVAQEEVARATRLEVLALVALENEVLDALARAQAKKDSENPNLAMENIMRSPIAPAALNAAKTHCPHGHPYDEDNTYRLPSKPSHRYCRACMRASSRARSRAWFFGTRLSVYHASVVHGVRPLSDTSPPTRRR